MAEFVSSKITLPLFLLYIQKEFSGFDDAFNLVPLIARSLLVNWGVKELWKQLLIISLLVD